MTSLSVDIIVIEDDPSFQFFYTQVFKIFNYSFQIFKDAESYVNIMKTIHCRLFIIDISLPGINGLDLVDFINLNIKYKSIPKFAITTLVSPQQIQTFKTLAFDKILKKPILIEQLKFEISTVLC